MKSKKKNKLSPGDLKFNNEFRKAKLQLEKGAHFHTSNNIPAEIESIFLDHIEKFEKAFKKVKQITVFEKIRKPKFQPISQIPAAQIKKEVKALKRKMAGSGIIVESVCPVPDREMYRFITEELFNHRIDSIPIKGMTTHFIYEEFHPNHEHDVKSGVRHFVYGIFSETEFMDGFRLSKKLKNSSGKTITAAEALKKINLFRSFYSKFKINSFEFSQVHFNKAFSEAEAFFDISVSATLEGSTEKQAISGPAKIILRHNDGFWSVYRMFVPGVKI